MYAYKSIYLVTKKRNEQHDAQEKIKSERKVLVGKEENLQQRSGGISRHLEQ